MADLVNLPVSALLILIGTIAVFLSIGGKGAIAELPEDVPKSTRKLVGFAGGLFILFGFLLVILPIFASNNQSLGDSNSLSLITPTITPSSTVLQTNTQYLTPAATQIVMTEVVSETETLLLTVEPEVDEPIVETPTTEALEIDEPPTEEPDAEETDELPNHEIFFQVNLASNQGVNIYTQPSEVTGAPRAQIKGGDVVEKLAENNDGGWYRVRILHNNIEGWIQADFLTATSETPPPPQKTPTSPSPTICLTVNIVREAIVNHDFDTITLRYSNWPAGTVDFAFEVYTVPQGGGRADLIDLTSTDTGTTFFEIAYTRFENQGFQPGTSFTYVFQPRNAAGEVLCTKSGSFTNP